MARSPLRLGRRALLVDLGRVTLGAVVLGVAACGDDEGGAAGPTTGAPLPAATTETGPQTPAATTEAGPQTPTAAADASPVRRVDLGFVSAYVLVRDGEAVLVDTGVAGSAPAIEEVLAAAGTGWGDLGHVVLTHLHPDHVGSLPAVLDAAAAATGYAGAADIPGIDSPRPLVPVGDGDDVVGLRIVATPGHTAGHIAVLDPVAGVLAAGDALIGESGGVAGPAPEFTDDMEAAIASVRKLGELTYDTVVFGHGPPVVGGAAAAVAALGAEL